MTVMQIVQQLFGSMGITMEIFFVTLITSLILGLGLALIRMSKNPILSVIAKFYISVMRGTPLDAAAACCIFWPFFYFRDADHAILPPESCPDRLCFKLCRLFCRDLQIRHCSNPRLVSTRRPECWDTANTDICLYCDASGHQADYSAGSQ